MGRDERNGRGYKGGTEMSCNFPKQLKPVGLPSHISRDAPYFGLCVPLPGLSLPGTQDVPYFGLSIPLLPIHRFILNFSTK